MIDMKEKTKIKKKLFFNMLWIIFLITIGFIIADIVYRNYPDTLFDRNFDDSSGLRIKLFDVALNDIGNRCARIAPSSFYNGLASAKSIGYSAITYAANMESCASYDEKYTGNYYIVYQNFTEEFCENG